MIGTVSLRLSRQQMQEAVAYYLSRETFSSSVKVTHIKRLSSSEFAVRAEDADPAQEEMELPDEATEEGCPDLTHNDPRNEEL